MIKIDKINLIKLLPYSLQDVKDIEIIIQITQEEFNKINEKEKRLFTYSDFTILDEAVLDELAYQWKTEGYEQTFSKEVKAKLVETSYVVRKTKGTRYAVEKTVKDIHGDFEVLEWWETDMNPYYFKIIGTTSPTGDKLREVYKAINMTKNERSFLEGIIVSNQWEGFNFHGVTNHISLFEEISFNKDMIEDIENYLGGIHG